MDQSMTEQHIIDRLHKEGCSCIIAKNDTFIICRQRGVKDLFGLLKESPESLNDAFIADKVVGKGAAALMISGKIKKLFADIISLPALELLKNASISVSYGKIVHNIINRKGTDICPVEKICRDCTTADECLPLIGQFLMSADHIGND